MNMKWLRPIGAALFLLMLCLRPGDALAAAAEALLSWALSVAPALLPFLITAPALTSPEICALLSRISGPFLRLFRLPINSTGALLIGLMSGSPAGAAALASVSPAETDPPGSYLRAALMASGASPAFLMTTAAVVLLNVPEIGWLLLRSQLLAVLAAGLVLRHAGTGLPIASAAGIRQPGSVSSATQTLLIIGGYMVLFSVLARLITCFTHPAFETPLLVLFELAGGSRALASLPHPLPMILPLFSAAACFGGLSVFMQCMSFLAPLGVKPWQYAAGKLLQSALAALFTELQLTPSWNVGASPVRSISCFSFLLLLLLGLAASRIRFPESTV